MASVYRIKGEGGVVIDSATFLEVPKAPSKATNDTQRAGMFRYNKGWEAFEGAITFDDGSVAYRRFAMLDDNGRLLTSQLPDSILAGLHYVGTYSPLSDDIDPPLTPGVYTPLPTPTTANSGEYYIVRGIMDAAQTHFNANPTAAASVIFTPTNPSGQGDWLQIKYYLDSNPTVPGSRQVTSAFGRIITPVPAGHGGLTSLAEDTELTDAFVSTATPATERALTDGDWVILNGTRAQRLRNSRVSILASTVMYDSTLLDSSGRGIEGDDSTVQSIIDASALGALRRTGDSMNKGGAGKGRLGVVYGSAAEPAIAFNDALYDPVTNTGIDPTQWTDTKTGIFHQATGTMGFSTSGVEKFRINPTGIIVIQAANVNPTTAPALQFQGTGNTANVGLSAINNIMTVSIANKNQVEFKDASTEFHGAVITDANMTVKGNTILGDTNTDTLVVNANSAFQTTTTFNGSSNRFKNLNMMPAGILTFEHATTATAISQITGNLKLDMTAFGDMTINDGAAVRTKFNRYGIGLPKLNPIDNAVGEDGMIAYSTQRNTVMQKSNGQWTTVSGGGVEQSFTTSSWVLSGSYYTYTITGTNIQSIVVQELVGSNYNLVEVDSVSISPTNAVLSIPATPDVRFNGRVIITYR